MSELADAPNKWVYPADALVNQCYYRILSFVSFHAPYADALEAIKYLAETKRHGNITEIKNWGTCGIAKWNDVEVYPSVKMSIWVFGTPRNTIYARIGWWKLYLIESMMPTFPTL